MRKNIHLCQSGVLGAQQFTFKPGRKIGVRFCSLAPKSPLVVLNHTDAEPGAFQELPQTDVAEPRGWG